MSAYYPQQDCSFPQKGMMPEQQREPFVAAQIKRLEMMIQRVEQDVEAIESRLSAVIRPSGPTACGNPSVPDECGIVPIAGHLCSLGTKLNNVSDRLRDIINRCEL